MSTTQPPPPIREAEILEQLRPVLAEVLGIPPEKVRAECTLIGDLGAESIDLLDLTFRIEERFHVTIQADEIERETRKRVVGDLYAPDGTFTDAALVEVRRELPEIEAERIGKGLRKSNLPSLLTVGFFVRLIARKQAAISAEVNRA